MPARIRRKTRTDGRRGAKLGIGAAGLSLLAGSALACAPDQLLIKDDDAAARFTVELALTPEEQGRGLMFRESLPTSTGMLFDFGVERETSFWMRNTLIPLDMLFISADGTVTKIHENAVPMDETPIFGGAAVRFVLEINGGLSRQLGIEAGAVIQHPRIPQDDAVFPCE